VKFDAVGYNLALEARVSGQGEVEAIEPKSFELPKPGV